MDTTPNAPRPTLRDRILDTAVELFSRKGVNAVGLESFEDAAGITRTALLHHFRSRDELVVAVVKRRNERWRAWLQQAVEKRSKTPRGRLLAVFYALDEWFDDPDFARLASIGASVSAADQSAELRLALRDHREWLRAYIRDLAIDAAVAYPERLSHTYLLLVEGAVATALSGAVAGPAQLARHAASLLLAEQDAYRSVAPGLLLNHRAAPAPGRGARTPRLNGSGTLRAAFASEPLPAEPLASEPLSARPLPADPLAPGINRMHTGAGAGSPAGSPALNGNGRGRNHGRVNGTGVTAMVAAGNADPRADVMGGPTRSGL